MICAGGGYGLVWSPGEGYPVAARLNRMGYHAFVVNYRTGDRARAPGPLDDLAASLRYLFDHRERLGRRSGRICPHGLLRRRASGRLLWDKSARLAGVRPAAPGALMLCYPVVTMGSDSEPGSRLNLLGPDPDPELARRYSLEEQIDPDYPPTYLWHCSETPSCPVSTAGCCATS